MMKTILVTGFRPFGGESINPSWEAVSRLPDQIGEMQVKKLELPVSYGEAADLAWRAAEHCGDDGIPADAILCVGQAGGRASVTPEMIGINLRFGAIPDENGQVIHDEPIDPEGPDAFFTTIPVREIAAEMGERGIPAKVSYSAGTYVCNDLLYTLLRRTEGTAVRVGFIHVPYQKEQEKEPCMELAQIVKALVCAVEVIGRNL